MTDVAGAQAPEPPGRKTSTPGAVKAQDRRIEIIVNPLSGGVGPRAARECEQLLETLNIQANLTEIDPKRMEASVSSALSGSKSIHRTLAPADSAAMTQGRTLPSWSRRLTTTSSPGTH